MTAGSVRAARLAGAQFAGADVRSAKLDRQNLRGIPESSDKAVKIALRPDNVDLAPIGDGPNRFKAFVRSRHYQGTQTLYELDTLGTTIEALAKSAGAVASGFRVGREFWQPQHERRGT